MATPKEGNLRARLIRARTMIRNVQEDTIAVPADAEPVARVVVHRGTVRVRELDK